MQYIRCHRVTVPLGVSMLGSTTFVGMNLYSDDWSTIRCDILQLLSTQHRGALTLIILHQILCYNATIYLLFFHEVQDLRHKALRVLLRQCTQPATTPFSTLSYFSPAISNALAVIMTYSPLITIALTPTLSDFVFNTHVPGDQLV